jgi:hypothetical protein
MVQANLGKKQGTFSKITRVKRAGGVAQVVEYLPHKHKALSSKPSTVKAIKIIRKTKKLYFASLEFIVPKLFIKSG